MSVYYCESCLTKENTYIDGGSLPITIDGQPSPNFNFGDGFYDNLNGSAGEIVSIQTQPDGKIIVGGRFDEYSGTSVGYGLIRLNSDGSIDTSFDIGTGFSYYGTPIVYTTQIQTDGKVLVGGIFDSYSGTSVGSIIRLESDGSIDTSFDIGNGFYNNSYVDVGYIYSIQIQSDGKIIVGGIFDSYSGTSVGNNLIRLESDGSIDTSFDVGTGFYDQVNTDLGNILPIQIQSDGKIIVGGFFDSYSGTSVGNNLIRLESDGSIDTSFDVGIGFDLNVTTIQLQSDGKIYVGGDFSSYSGSSYNKIIRLNTDGSIDTSFVIGTGFNNAVFTIRLQSDNKILVGGAFTSYSGVTVGGFITLNTDGSIDNIYNFSAFVVNVILLYSNNTIIIGGIFFDYPNGIRAINTETSIIYSTDFRCYSPQYLTNGLIDINFLIGQGFNGTVNDVKLQSDGKILLGGSFTSYIGVTRNRIIRLNTDGSIDNGFVIGSGFNSIVNSIQLQSDGKILVGGLFMSYSGVSRNRIIRLNTDGSVDTGFVIGGGFNPGTSVNSIQVQSDGKILVGGSFITYNGVSYNRIIRLNSDGSVDTSFVIGTGFSSTVNMIELQPDGKILVGGQFGSYNNIACVRTVLLNPDGSIDTSYNTGSGFDRAVYTLTKRSDGKILVGGDFTIFSGNSIGYLDLDFNVDLLNSLTYSSLKNSNGDLYIGYSSGFRKLNSDGSTQNQSTTNNNVLSIEELSDSNLLLAGTFTTYNNSINGGLVKVDTSGNKIAGFDVGIGFNGSNVNTTKELPSGKILVGGNFVEFNNNIVDTNFGGGGLFNNTVQIAIGQPDGKLLIGGQFTSYSGVSYNRLIRLNSDGSIDTSFVIGVGFNSSTISTIQYQTDGKIIIGGSFSTYSGVTRNRIIRLNTDGSIDNSFVIGTGFTVSSTVSTIQLQPDGKILAGGSFTSYSGVNRNRIIRLNSDGSVDNSFVIGTGFTVGSTVNTIELQPDGKILAGGTFTSYSGVNRNRIIRLNSDGSVDNSFVIGTGFNVSTIINTLQLQPDNKILVGGFFTSYSGVSRTNIIRLNTDGSIDTSFVIGTGFNNTVFTIELRPDNKILVGGQFTSYSSVTRNRFISLNTDGSIDTSFVIGSGAGGTVSGFIPKTGFTFVYGLFTTINGISQNRFSIVNYSGSTGTTVNRFGRLNSDGTYDTTFSANTGFTNTVRKIDTQPDNKIIVAGDFTSYSGQLTNRIVRLNTDYTLDTSFDTLNLFNGNVNDFEILSDGKILVGGDFTRLVPLNSKFNYTVYAVEYQPDGKILVGGDFSSYSGVSRNRIIRLNTDGSIDTSFVIGTGFNNVVRTIELQSDGKILVGGFFFTYSGLTVGGIIRLNSDGSFDSNLGYFSEGGLVGTIYDIQLQSDNKIIVGGIFDDYDFSGGVGYSLIRLNTDGSVDGTFSVGSGFSWIGGPGTIYSTQIQSDGKILVGGEFDDYNGNICNGLIRLESDGTIDSSFYVDGTNGFIYSTQIQSDGKILVGGDFTSYSGVTRNNIVRLNTDGSIDTSFVIGTGFNDTVNTIRLQSDGKILVGGNFFTYSGVSRNYIVRLNTDGSIDTSFVIGIGFNFNVTTIELQPDGKILVGGFFTSYNGVTSNRIIRLNTDGSTDDGVGCGRIARLNNNGTIDLSFNSVSGFDAQVRVVEIESDGKYLVGGDFITYSGISSNRIARLNTDGSYDSTFIVNFGFNSSVYTITQVSNQFILVGGNFLTYDFIYADRACQLHLQSSPQVSFNKFAILNSDGSADTSVNIGTGFSDSVRSIVIQPDGKTLVGGLFTSYSGISINRFIRLSNDYSKDVSFDTGTGFNNSVFTSALQPDGKILIGGDFTNFNGEFYDRIIRLLPEEPTAEYQAMFLFDDCEVCNGYVIPISANTEYDECRICNDVAVSVDPPHPVWTGLNGGAVTQMNAVLLGGNGLNS